MIYIFPGLGWGLRFWVWGLGFRDWSFGFQVPSSGCRVSGFRFRVSGFRIGFLGFRISYRRGFQASGFEFRIDARLFLVPRSRSAPARATDPPPSTALHFKRIVSRLKVLHSTYEIFLTPEMTPIPMTHVCRVMNNFSSRAAGLSEANTDGIPCKWIRIQPIPQPCKVEPDSPQLRCESKYGLIQIKK